MNKGLAVLVSSCFLAGCTTIGQATADRTSLAGEVPDRLGRILEVQVAGEGDAELHAALREAIKAEFESRDLFDHVIAAVDSGAVAGRQASRLDVVVERVAEEELFDLLEFQGGFVVRYELEVFLRDSGGRLALEGHVSGIGEDTVTDTDVLDDATRADVRTTAMHDAGMKISRGLRLTADARASEAFDALERITLAPGVGPLDIAVLGFDESSRRRRGPLMAGQVARGLQLLGPDLRVTPPEDILRAMEKLPRSAFMELGPRQLEAIAKDLPARVFVMGELEFTGEHVRARAKVCDREGKVLQEHELRDTGLGALRVLAARLAHDVGDALVASPPTWDPPDPGQ
jgi:hypothetical protein